jgi:glucose/arabinose dehydrogenase
MSPSPAGWGDRRPTVPDGYTITPIATDLKIPRQTLVLPNGDILVAEGKGGGDAPKLRPKDMIAGYIKAGDQPGRERRPPDPAARRRRRRHLRRPQTVFAENLNAPYGLALIGNRLFVANQDALVRFDYRPGQIRASGSAGQGHSASVRDQPSLDQGDDGEPRRALPLCRHRLQQQHRRARHGGRGRPRDGLANRCRDRRARRPYATGLRNPTALAIQPGLGQLWAVVNERDELGPNLVPDYLTSGARGRFLRLALQPIGART